MCWGSRISAWGLKIFDKCDWISSAFSTSLIATVLSAFLKGDEGDLNFKGCLVSLQSEQQIGCTILVRKHWLCVLQGYFLKNLKVYYKPIYAKKDGRGDI